MRVGVRGCVSVRIGVRTCVSVRVGVSDVAGMGWGTEARNRLVLALLIFNYPFISCIIQEFYCNHDNPLMGNFRLAM